MSDHSVKGLFLDLDGTFLNDAKQLPEENRKALNDMLAQGHKAIITTGRPLPSAILQAEHLGLSGPGCYLIAYNGGVLYDTGERNIIFERTIPLNIVREIFDEANRRNVHIQAYDRKAVLVEPRCDNDAVRFYCRRIEMEWGVVPSVSELTEEPAKLLMIDRGSREPLEAMKEWVISTYPGVIDSFFSSKELLEVMPAGLSKGDGLMRLAKLIGMDIADTVAIGDEENDISMIRAAGIGVAMKNAIAAAKEAADYITEQDNNHGGAAEAIRRFILN